MQCSLISLPREKSSMFVNLNCPYGKIANITENGIGINSYTQKIRDACVVNSTLFGNDKCSSGIDYLRVENYFKAKCFGKQKCKIEIEDDSDLTDGFSIFDKTALKY